MKQSLAVILANKNKELELMVLERAKRAAELELANAELTFQNEEKAKRSAELLLANKELVFQNKEKAKRAAELEIANVELALQNEEKAKRSAELLMANSELLFQNQEKVKRAAELEDAIAELAYQNEEKIKRASELILANTELAQYKYALDAAANLLIVDKDGTISHVNDSCYQISKYTREELIGSNPRILDSGYHPEAFWAEMYATINNGKTWRRDVRNRAKDGSFYWQDTVVVPFMDENGQLLKYLAIRYEITERKKMEADLLALNIELKAQIEQIRLHTIKLSLANEALEAFSYSVSHDLRAPLRVIRGYAGLIMSDYSQEFNADLKSLFSYIIAEAKRMDSIITDVLTLAKCERQDLDLREVDMSLLFAEVWDYLNLTQPNLARIVRGEMPCCLVDRSLMKQVLINLLGNAIKYSSKKEKPEVNVSCELKNGEHLFSIHDNGAGFDMRYGSKLFKAFQRLHESADFEGTGIGLTLVYSIIQKHGGNVWAESIVNEGATFYFSLPIPVSAL
jgi:PAS domain S-box-containing protein